MRKLPAKDRFEEKVMPEPNTGCWFWTGALIGPDALSKANSYGVMWYEGRYELSHRISYLMHKGTIPSGMFVCHSCDNKLCVNPDHLWLGDHKDNMHDMVVKGLRARGSKHQNSKLTESQVEEIKHDKGFHRRMAVKFGISITHVSRIKKGSSWSHIK